MTLGTAEDAGGRTDGQEGRRIQHLDNKKMIVRECKEKE